MADLGSLESRVATHSVEIDSLNSRLDRIEKGIEGIADKMGERSRTNWGTLAAWAAVIIAVMGLYSSGYVRDLGEQAGRLESLQEREIQNTTDLARANEVLSRHDKLILDIDTMLQREMRLLDEVLQREIHLNRQLVERDIGRLEALIDVNKQSILERTPNVRFNGGGHQ